MSSQASAWAAKQRGIGPHAKLVLVYLADGCSIDNTFSYQFGSISEFAGMSIPEVLEALVELEEHHVIRLTDIFIVLNAPKVGE